VQWNIGENPEGWSSLESDIWFDGRNSPNDSGGLVECELPIPMTGLSSSLSPETLRLCGTATSSSELLRGSSLHTPVPFCMGSAEGPHSAANALQAGIDIVASRE